MVSPSTADLSHRQQASTGNIRGCRRTQRIGKGESAVTSREGAVCIQDAHAHCTVPEYYPVSQTYVHVK
jgi:hypothetical protein